MATLYSLNWCLGELWRHTLKWRLFNVRFWLFETNSVIKTQRRYRTQYGEDPPLDNAIQQSSLKKLVMWRPSMNWSSELLPRSEELVTPQMLENTSKEIEYRLDILHGMKVVQVEVVWHISEVCLYLLIIFMFQNTWRENLKFGMCEVGLRAGWRHLYVSSSVNSMILNINISSEGP
jgi:hypothetical protein